MHAQFCQYRFESNQSCIRFQAPKKQTSLNIEFAAQQEQEGSQKA